LNMRNTSLLLIKYDLYSFIFTPESRWYFFAYTFISTVNLDIWHFSSQLLSVHGHSCLGQPNNISYDLQ